MHDDQQPHPSTLAALEYVKQGEWDLAASMLADSFVLDPCLFTSSVRERLRVPLWLRGLRLIRLVGQGFVVRTDKRPNRERVRVS